MARINRTIELLTDGESVYYEGGHTGHVLTHEQGRQDAGTWADYINVGMEHGAFDMTGLDNYMQGLIDGGPTASGHRTPAIIVETPVEGSSEEIIRFNAWQFRMILARGQVNIRCYCDLHGLIFLCSVMVHEVNTSRFHGELARVYRGGTRTQRNCTGLLS